MEDYTRKVEQRELIGHYYSPGLGDFDAKILEVTVSVVGPQEETVWERTVRDRMVHTAIPLPFFDKRLGRIVTRANALVDTFNTAQ